jgi:hypothetical protein
VTNVDSQRGKHYSADSSEAHDETRVRISITRASFTLSIYKGALKTTEKQIALGSARIVGLTTFSLGTVALAASVIFTYSVLAFAGSALVLLSPMMTYIPAADYVKGHNLRTRGAKMLQKMNTKVARTNSAKVASSLMLLVGIILLIGSSLGASTVFAFIGISLTFWGALLLYIRPSKYVKSELLTASFPSLANMDTLIRKSKTQGKAVYLPPKNLKNIESSIVLIPRHNPFKLPASQTDENHLLKDNSEGLYLTPPGISLSQLFERTLGTSFTRADLQFLQDKLPKLFIEQLEIAEGLTIEAENNTITVKLRKNVFSDMCHKTTDLQRIHESIGCPLCSAIACALAKTTGKPVTIEKEQTSDETTTIQYRILED